MKRPVVIEPRRHPSGRPIARSSRVGRPIWRVPDHGAVVPRLREERKDLSMIGFRISPAREDDEG